MHAGIKGENVRGDKEQKRTTEKGGKTLEKEKEKVESNVIK